MACGEGCEFSSFADLLDSVNTFNLNSEAKKTAARAGTLSTAHGDIKTPIFMPVGTAGTVKGIMQQELLEIGSQIILGNTYHLYLRPGTEMFEQAGGLHKFMNWNKPILTDSGGYQIFSLADRRKIHEDGATFSSHIDGSKHEFSPENVMDIQRSIGADIIMAFDECPPYPAEKKYVEDSMHMTHRWFDRCSSRFYEGNGLYGYDQTLFPIIQGGVFPDLRKKSAEYLSDQKGPGVAIGGLSVGEPVEDMYSMTELVCNIIPVEKARYLMGVGTPLNIIECIDRGIDMFDCVMPTRNARNGMLFTWDGVVNIRNRKWKSDLSPIDNSSTLDEDKVFSKAYLRHLFQCKEMLGPMLATKHNLNFYLELMGEARRQILDGNFSEWKGEMSEKLGRRL